MDWKLGGTVLLAVIVALVLWNITLEQTTEEVKAKVLKPKDGFEDIDELLD